MATCHSLRVVDDKLIGDPLDLKMFEFTGWSFEEGEHRSDQLEEVEQGRLSPSVARPPPGAEYDVDDDGAGSKVSHSPLVEEVTDIVKTSPIELGVLRSFEFIPQLRRSSVVVRRFGATDGDVYVKGAPECIKAICDADSGGLI